MTAFRADDTINNRYKVLRLLGRGAMGEVYLVEDVLKVHRLVALKVLKNDHLDEADFWSRGEYEALTRLKHPNLAHVYDFARIHDSDDFYIVSEFIHGEDLLIATEGMDFDELLDVLAQICRALEYIHLQGYVHFDIKPDNILVTREREAKANEGSKVEWNPAAREADRPKGPPRAKLIDFGLAERISGTFNFAIKGTFHYVAPEIIAGLTPDKRADLYSLGITLHQILTDQIPFTDETGKSLDRSKINWRESIRQELADRPDWLADIILRLLEEDPDKRFQSARAIIQALNAGSGRHYELETAETQMSYLYSSRLIGRRKELNRLKEEAEATFPKPVPIGERKGSGKTSVVSRLLREGGKRPPLTLVTGEIGIGKSRLFAEFEHFLKLREIDVHSGNCYETNHDAYHPFREVLEQLALSVGLDSEVFQKHSASLRKLCPKLRSSHEEEVVETGMRADKERLFFMDDLTRFIISAATSSPCVIHLNNMHWVDEASIELLAHLVDKIAEVETTSATALPLMICATQRSDETLGDVQRQVLTGLRDDERTRDIMLRRLSRPQIAELIHSMLQLGEIPTPFLDRLEERTSGNPLFIVETLKTLQEEGIIAREGESWKIRGGGDLSRIEIPHGIEAILLRRVRMLDGQHQRLLEALSVCDKPVSSRLLERIPDLSRINVAQCLRELENRGMVHKHFDQGRIYHAIAQPKLREITYQHINDERRNMLHGALAEALIADQGETDENLEDLAHHFQRSDKITKCLEYTLRAGDLCRRVFAHDRAIGHYRQVIKQTQGYDEHQRVWFQTNEKIGDIETLSGNYEEAKGSYDALLQFADSNPVLVGVVDHARVLRKRGKLDEIRGEYDRALRSLKEARDLFEDAKVSEENAVSEEIRIYNAIGWAYVCMGKYDKAMRISVDALRKIEGVEERGEHAMVFSTIGSSNFFKGQLDQAIEFHSRALEIREHLENVPEIVISLNNLGDAYLESGEYMEALGHFRRALDAASQIGDAFGRAMALHNLSKTHLALGDDEGAGGYLRESLKLSKEFNMRYLNTLNYMQRGRLRRRGEELAKAENDLFRALGTFAKQGTRWGLCLCLLEVSELQSQRGNDDEALRLAHEAIENAMALKVESFEVRAKLLEIRVLRSKGGLTHGELLQKLEMLEQILDGRRASELLGSIALEKSELLVQARRLDEARTAYRQAEEYFREIADRLPSEFRESYLTAHNVSGSGDREFREVPVETARPAVESTAPAAPALDDAQSEMLRIGNLLQEFSQSTSPQVFVQKVLTCLIQAVGADEGFLLHRDGDRARVMLSFDRRGQRVKQAGERLCLEALQNAWDLNEPVLAPRVLDDPRVQSFESLYRANVTSLAIIPLKPDAQMTAALYLNNPDPSHLENKPGSPVLLSYQNLLQLTIPKPKPTPA